MSLESPPRLKHDSELGPMLRVADETAMTSARIAANGAAIKATIAGGMALASPLFKITLFVAVLTGGVVVQRQLASDDPPTTSAPASRDPHVRTETPAAAIESATVAVIEPAADEEAAPVVEPTAVVERSAVVHAKPPTVEPTVTVKRRAAADPASAPMHAHVKPPGGIDAQPPSPSASPRRIVSPPRVAIAIGPTPSAVPTPVARTAVVAVPRPPAIAPPPRIGPPAGVRTAAVESKSEPVTVPPPRIDPPSPRVVTAIEPRQLPPPRTEPPPTSDLPIQIRLYEEARTAKSRNQFAIGLARLDELVRRFPATPLRADVDLTRAELLILSERLGEAAMALEALAADSLHGGRRGELLRTLGDIHRKQNDCPRAIEAYTRARAAALSAKESSRVERGIERCAATR